MKPPKSITITNSTVNFYEHDIVAEARDELLRRLFYARHKDTIGGYDNWLKLLDYYYCGEFEEMIENIGSIKGTGGATRKACLRLINTIVDANVDAKGEN